MCQKDDKIRKKIAFNFCVSYEFSKFSHLLFFFSFCTKTRQTITRTTRATSKMVSQGKVY